MEGLGILANMVWTTAWLDTWLHVLVLHMTVGIPADSAIAAVRGEFMDFCDELNLDAMLTPVR